MTTSKTFYNVSIVATPEDDGYTVTFDDLEAAKDCARHARDNGCWNVRPWRS